MAYKNVLLIILEAVLYFSTMLALLRASKHFGIGVFICVLGVVHFLETYLASVFYIDLPLGATASPGSTVLFSGKLILILLVYILEDANTARQPIYGLFVGNAMVLLFAFSLSWYGLTEINPGRLPDFAFINEMGWLMAWGTMLLFIDSILIILLYEKLHGWLKQNVTLRILISSALILTFDQFCFYIGLQILTDAPASVLWSGWIAKLVMALIYSPLAGAYLRWSTYKPWRLEGRGLWDVFETLTYRERYEELLQKFGTDRLTGVLDRGSFESKAPIIVSEALQSRVPISLLLIDLDHFKEINDRFGHLTGDEILRATAQRIRQNIREVDLLFRYGGDEFVLLCPGLSLEAAQKLGERLRVQCAEVVPVDGHPPVTLSIGIASGPISGSNVYDLFENADKQLYGAKNSGRNRVVVDQVLSEAS